MRFNDWLEELGVISGMLTTMSQALSLKNAAINYMNSTMRLIEEENTIISGNERSDSIKLLETDYIRCKEFLIRLKADIAKANSDGSNLHLIFALEEISDEVSRLEKISTKSGKHYQAVGDYGDSSVEVVYESTLDKSYITKRVNKLKLEHTRLQDELSTNNATIKFAIEVPEKEKPLVKRFSTVQ